jgi:hypothetical protein
MRLCVHDALLEGARLTDDQQWCNAISQRLLYKYYFYADIFARVRIPPLNGRHGTARHMRATMRLLKRQNRSSLA